MDVDRLLSDLYYTTGLPTTYSSIDRLWKAAKRVNTRVKKEDVEAWLLAQDVYTLHRRARKRLSAEPRVYVKGIDEQWAIDLCDVSNISEFNDGCNFILTVIDVFSKFAFAEPVMRKTGPVTTRSMEAILQRTQRRPQRFESDQGKEFYNAQFSALCRRENIHHFSSQSSHKASVVERFNRSLKELMYKHFTARNTYRWTDVLDSLMDTYNKRYHRSIGRSPESVSDENEAEVYRKLFAKKPKRGPAKTTSGDAKTRVKAGDFIRISKKKHIFEKGYLPNFTEEVFKVAKVITNHTPHRYELEDMAGEKIVGRFAPEEIQKSIKGDDDMWKIEKVIRKVKRRGEDYYFVKWRGFPDKFNSLVKSTDIVQLAEAQ